MILLIKVKLSGDLMDPESEEVSREWGALVGGEKEALEHVAEIKKTGSNFGFHSTFVLTLALKVWSFWLRYSSLL